MTKKPAHKIRDGRISATFWEQSRESGGSFYSVTFDRTYTTTDGKYASSTSFGRRQLLALQRLVGEAEAWLRLAETTNHATGQESSTVESDVRKAKSQPE